MITRFLTDLVKYICKDQSWFLKSVLLKKEIVKHLQNPALLGRSATRGSGVKTQL